jgi:pimeloyl-ACP methyl ester carboxylesterase
LLILLCPGLPLAPFTSQWMLRGMPMILKPSVATVKWFIDGASTSRNYDDLMQVFIAGMTGVRSTKILRPQIGEDEWKRLQMPILLLIGDHEIMYEPARAIRQAKQWMPHIQAALIKNAGHFLLADQPEQVTQRALKFLDAVE